jgi:hypothetical protein
VTQPACTHTGQFAARLHVERTVSGSTVTYRAQLQMNCSKCGLPFLFNGMSTINPLATLLSAPATSADKKSMFVPIAPGT